MEPKSLNDSRSSPTKGGNFLLNRPVVSIVAVVAIALFALMGFKYYLDSKAGGMRYQVGSAESSARSGDFSTAEQLAQQVIAGSSAGENPGAYTVVEVAKFMSGDKASRIEAVRLAKQQYTSATPQGKTLIINMLIGFVTTKRDGQLFDEVFTGVPFGELRVENNSFLTIRKFAELSISLHPTSIATLQVASWHAAQILSAPRLKLTAQQKKEHANAILGLIDDAALLYESEQLAVQQALFSPLHGYQYHNRLAYLYGATAYVEPKYLVQSEEEYALLYAAYGDGEAIARAWLPYAYYSNALFLNSLGGANRKADVQSRLASLVALIDANPALYRGTFLSRVDALKNQTKETGGVEYRQFKLMADASPAFKAFLKRQGVVM